MSAFHEEGGGDDISLNLTALMDILSNLLFFLLASYSAQAMEVNQKGDFKLPSSSSQVKLQKAAKVTVTRHEITVEGVHVADLDGTKISGTEVTADDKIVALYDRLRGIAASRAAAELEAANSDHAFILLADHATDATVITRILKTAGMAGFVDVRFGVIAQ